ncbi:NAD(P)-binding protein [Bimuria novae-zelandiae CBS 107.79]|uniref:NAD(P)-binding protein n=1 Tax=Bimuria novae-zelandiae CBS 107.79 TaxID=1447943 RepID=A0A6A5VN79_9PLEO|nr:NAD(P)-binding protein [Bimuria novae-zelandiae CBS 107.79]
MAPWSLVSPASRGIGFALARRVLQTTKAPLVATARKDLESTRERLLEGLDVDEKRLTMLELDVLAFVIPGILYPEKSPAQINADDTLLTFRTNTLGPMLMIKHFAPFLAKKRSETPDPTDLQGLPNISTMAIMSARVGSISDNRLGGWYSYRASKAAVNQLVKTFDNHLRMESGEKAMSIALHPGTVKTEFSKEFWGGVKKEKLFEKEWVAERLVDVVRTEGVEGRGRCWDWEGKEVPP